MLIIFHTPSNSYPLCLSSGPRYQATAVDCDISKVACYIKIETHTHIQTWTLKRYVQWNPINTTTVGPWNFDSINEVVRLRGLSNEKISKHMQFVPQKSGHNVEVILLMG